MLNFYIYTFILFFLIISLIKIIIVIGGFFIICVLPVLLNNLLSFFNYILIKLFDFICLLSPFFYNCYYTILQSFHENAINSLFDLGHYAVDNPVLAINLVLQMFFVMFLPVHLWYTLSFSPVIFHMIAFGQNTGLFLFVELSIIDNILQFYNLVCLTAVWVYNGVVVAIQYSGLIGEFIFFNNCCLFIFLVTGKPIFYEILFFSMFANLLAIIFYIQILWNIFIGYNLYFIESSRGFDLFKILYKRNSDFVFYQIIIIFIFLIMFL